MTPHLLSSASSICKRVLTHQTIILLIAASIVLTTLFFHTNSYPVMNDRVELIVSDLDGVTVEYPEPNNVGLALLTYVTAKATPLDYFWSLILWQYIGFAGFLLTFYKLTNSWKLTALTLAYPFVLINTLLGDTSLVMFGIVLAIYLYLKGKKHWAFSICLVFPLFRHEGVVFFGALLLYEFFSNKAYSSSRKLLSYLATHWVHAAFCVSGVAIYMFFQNFFYGHPLANFLLNTTENIVLNFPWHAYALRYTYLLLMIATSVLLYFQNRVLFAMSASATVVYLYFGLFGFEYTLFAVQAYFSWMYIFSVICIGYLLADEDFKKSLLGKIQS